MSDDLVTWLREQIDEDEWVAQGAARTDDGRKGHWTPVGLMSTDDARVDDHIARHDPVRVLREVEAKRRLLRQFELRGRSVRAIVQPETGGVWDDLLRMLALPYADRPDYRDEWRP